MGIGAIKHGWAEYLQQPVLPASIAYVLLYFNIVLTPGGLMTTFLTQRGMFYIGFEFSLRDPDDRNTRVKVSICFINIIAFPLYIYRFCKL